VTKIDIAEARIPTGEDIVKAQVAGVFENLLEVHEDFFEFDDALIPDLSEFTKEELVHKLLQFQLKDLALYYKDKQDILEQKMSNRDDDRGGRNDRRDRDRGPRDRDRDRGPRGDRDGRSDRGGDRRGADRGGKPRQRDENMTRFFFNLGKKDQLKKLDVLEIINKATTSKGNKRAEIGNIEILEKFSFFEIEKSYKNELLGNIQSMKFKGKDMRAEEAN
ncbi:DbpA RNA binding domain-containing protein, partial [Chryseobacterium sp.]